MLQSIFTVVTQVILLKYLTFLKVIKSLEVELSYYGAKISAVVYHSSIPGQIYQQEFLQSTALYCITCVCTVNSHCLGTITTLGAVHLTCGDQQHKLLKGY